MGGPGSGSQRFRRLNKKGVVEDCMSLDANRWTSAGILGPGIRRSGGWLWRDRPRRGDTTALRYELCTRDLAAPWLRVRYTLRGETMDYRIRLTTTRPHRGGLRWWFVCPQLRRNGLACGRRVGQLHLTPRGRMFACRQCLDLTYTSSQQHSRRVARYRKSPAALRTELAIRPSWPLTVLALRLAGEGSRAERNREERLGRPASSGR
jgi:hypothetical protein